jgi:hypothetical protein
VFPVWKVRPVLGVKLCGEMVCEMVRHPDVHRVLFLVLA